MAVITYTAKRSIIDTHTAGNSYTLSIPVEKFSQTGKQEKSEAESIGGNQVVTLDRITKKYRVSTIPMLHEEVPQVDEFIDSVAAGEEFTMESPLGPEYVCKLAGQPVWSQVNSVGYYSISFQILVVGIV